MPLSYAREKRYWRKAKAAPFELQEEWLLNYTSPFPNPKRGEPGPGSWVSADPGGNMTTNLGSLVIAGAMPGAWDVLRLENTLTFGRRAGRYLEFEMTPTGAVGLARIGWNAYRTANTNAANAVIANNEANIYFGVGGYVLVTDGPDAITPYYPYTPGTSYVFRIQDTGEGFLYYARTTLAGNNAWTLLWHRERSTPHLTTLAATFNHRTLTAGCDYMHVRQGWVKPPSLFLAQPGRGQTGDQGSADCLLDARVLAPRDADRSLYFRMSDDSNYWRARMHTNLGSGSYDLYQCVAGVETLMDTTPVEWGSGTVYPLKIVMFADHVRCLYGINMGPAVSDPFNQTATLCGTGPTTSPPVMNDGDITNFRVQVGGRLLLD